MAAALGVAIGIEKVRVRKRKREARRRLIECILDIRMVEGCL